MRFQERLRRRAMVGLVVGGVASWACSERPLPAGAALTQDTLLHGGSFTHKVEEA